MRPSYREWYDPSPHLAGAVVGTIALLAPGLATWGGWVSPMPVWSVLVLAAAGLGFAAWTAVLALRCRTALVADADGLRLRTAGGPHGSERLTLPWKQIELVRAVKAGQVLYLEVVRTADAPPVPAAFRPAPGTAGGSADGNSAVLPIDGWLLDPAMLAAVGRAVAPRVRYGRAVPARLARLVKNRETDRDGWGPGQRITSDSFRFMLRYLGGLAACLLFGLGLVGFWADYAAHLGHGRPGVWTAAPATCGRTACHTDGRFVPDDGGPARTGVPLQDDSTLHPAGTRVQVLDTRSPDGVYASDAPGKNWPEKLEQTGVGLALLGVWIWFVPARAARDSRKRAGAGAVTA